MIILACLLSALVGLTVGGLLSARWTRRKMAAGPQTFRCKLSAEPHGAEDGSDIRWPRMMSHASWVHDVLLVSSGLWQARVRPIAVHFVDGPIEGSPVPRGLGREPVVLALQLDDGRRVRLAATRRDRLLAAGPFLAAVALSERTAAPHDTS